MRFHRTARLTLVSVVALLMATAVAPSAFAAPRAASADLSLSVQVGPAQPNTRERVTYTYSVHNNGPATATDVFLETHLPGQAAEAASSCQWAGGGDVECWLPNIPSGATVQVATLRAEPRSLPGTVTATASVSLSTTDPHLADNSLTTNTYVYLAPPLPAACGQACATPLTTTRAQRAALLLSPSAGFTGVLDASLVDPASGQVLGTVAGAYSGGVLVAGSPRVEGDLPAGDWVLVVAADLEDQQVGGTYHPASCWSVSGFCGNGVHVPIPAYSVPGATVPRAFDEFTAGVYAAG